MYKEIDLHGMNYEDALRIFIQKYNEMIRRKEKKKFVSFTDMDRKDWIVLPFYEKICGNFWRDKRENYAIESI